MTAAGGPPLEISVEQLAAWRKDGVAHLLLDVREPSELARAAVAGALPVPMNAVPGRIDDLPKDRPIVVMCHHGGRSGQVMMWLRANGFSNATNLAGGIDAWAVRIDPAVGRY